MQLAAARLEVALRPFDRVAARLGRPQAARVPIASPPPSDRLAAAQAAQAARAIGWAVGVAAPLVPFRSLCLEKALAVTAMLRRRGIGAVTRFGVASEGAPGLAAHAWVEAAGVEVTGYPVPASLQEIGCFVSEPRA